MSPSRRIFLRAAAACVLTLNFAVAEPHAVLMQTLSGEAFESWSGLEIGSKEAWLAVPGEAVWHHPDGVRGGYHHGFRSYNDGAADWHELYGLQFEAKVDSAENVEITVSLAGTPGENLVTARTFLTGGGWQTLTLPWSAFDAPGARRDYLLAVKELRIKAAGAGGVVKLRNVRAVKAPALSLDAEVRGKAVPSGGTVEYLACVGNVTEAPQAVMLSFARHGWEAMSVSVEPSTFVLGSGETRAVKVRVQVPSNVPPGGHEVQILQAVPNGDATRAAQVTFVTAGALSHPNILHDKAGWNEVREKVKSYPWAREAQDALAASAEKWMVPEIAQPPGNDPNDNYGPFVFPVSTEREVYATAVAWQLTRNKAYAEKVALFLRRLSDPVAGYPKTLRAMNNSLVQEGGYFQHAAMAYDMVLDAGVLSEADRAQIDHTFRQFMETVDRASLNSQISNWNVATMTGALYCALSMQDLAAAERFYSGPGGLCDQLANGVMDDGWWYECAISYNAWVASEFSQAAIALRPWGINFKDAMLPANYSSSVMLIPQLSGGGKIARGPGQPPNRPFGMTPDIWGRQSHPVRDIRQMWNSLLPFLDYRGVMFGVNDSTERRQTESRGELGGASPFELAYYLYRDPAYAALIKLGNGPRDLLYGVPELPADTPRFFEKSACADNVGLVMLRSQTARRPIREQIHATLHYGTHGWAHGHYDRTNLLSLMRYGKSFYNPEMIWYGYPSFMYKFYVQNSVAHNMVVVDEKNQEATPGDRLLFHSGRLMQAAAVETKARWSNPPYGGMVYDYTTAKNFEEKTWQEGRSVPIPKDPPAYGALSGYTEPILQRRLMVVTDDYVVLADYVKGTQPHRFENLFQIKGFRGLEAAVKERLRHDAQWNPDPVGSAQFVTDCDWYSVKAPAKASFETRFEPGGRDQVNESGVLKMDVHTVWPTDAEVMVGTAPENIPVQKRLYYSVRGDGKTLAEGKIGAWILGQGEIDVPLEGIARMELETRVDDAKKPTVFWGGARIVTRDGKEIPLGELAPRFQNVEMPPKRDADYLEGPVKIAGIEQKYSTPGEPKNPGEKALISVDLTGKNAMRLKATVGGDYPLGGESQMRKTYAIKPHGDAAREACFLTLIEPYENRPAIKRAEALNDGLLRVELNDGRVQEINIRNFKGSGKDIEVSITETRAGQTQTETTGSSDD